MNIVDFYRNIVKYAGLNTDDDGNIYIVDSDGTQTPVTIENKPLVLPTQQQLSSLTEVTNSGVVRKVKEVFHPLKESAIKVESPVLSRYRKYLSLQMDIVTALAIRTLLNYIGSPELQKKKTNKEKMKLMTMVSKIDKGDLVDEKTFNNFERIIDKGMSTKPGEYFVRLVLKRGDVIDGVKYNRVAYVSFPFYNRLIESKDRVIDGVKLRVKDVELLKTLYEYMFEDVNEEWRVGSKSKVSPGMDALLRASERVMRRLDKVLKSFKDAIDEDWSPIDFSFMEYLDDIDSKKGEINSLPVTDSNKQTNTRKEQTTVQQPTQQPQPTVQQTTQQPAPQPPMQPQQSKTPIRHTGKGIDPRSILEAMGVSQQPVLPQASQSMAMQQPMGVQQPMIQQPMGMQPMGMQQPMGVQQPMMQQPMGMQQPMLQQPMMQQPMGVQQPMMQQPMGMQPMGMQTMMPGVSNGMQQTPTGPITNRW